MQPARTALDAGAIIATGTDYSSLPQDPWPLIEGMAHRRNPWLSEGESEANNSAEATTLEEAIYAYTMGGAHAMLAEDRLGSIEQGKFADFIVLDRNLLEIPLDDRRKHRRSTGPSLARMPSRPGSRSISISCCSSAPRWEPQKWRSRSGSDSPRSGSAQARAARRFPRR